MHILINKKCDIINRYAMAVNQSQVDHIITAASEDDPEVKLQNLEREDDLIKTSIKRLLMDIRERMNELENPFTLAAAGAGAAAPAPAANINSEVDDAKKSAMEAREAALDARESQLDATKAKMESEKKTEVPADKPQPARQAPAEDRSYLLDDQVLALLRSQAAIPQKPAAAVAVLPPATALPPVPAAPVNEKLRLQKVYKLFKWTHQSVKKFGHDRLEIMLESYRAMGYITKESCDEIREISRLMPANLGEENEVGPDEFVAELYALNRILVPSDTSLDRDMIEVMMEKRSPEHLSKDISSAGRIEFTGSSLRESQSAARKNGKDEEWMNLPDRI
jgi:hypothetical protein